MDLTAATANVRHARAPWRPLADVVGWQEADEVRWQVAAAKAMRGKGGMFVPALPAGRAVTITWGNGITLAPVKPNQGATMTHRGWRIKIGPNRYKGISPNRFVAWVILERDGHRWAHVNSHYINGVRGRGKFPAKDRRAKWADHHAKLCAIVAELREQGLPVVVTGDFNQTPDNVNIRGLSAVWSAHRDGIDQVHYSDEFTVTGQRQGDAAGSDHEPLIVSLRLGAPDPEVPVNTADRVIAIAKEQVGYHEGRSGGHWNNQQKFSPAAPGLEWSQGQAWCATFVSWVAMRAGAADLFPRTASCDQARAWWKAEGRWSEYPCIGGQVIFGVPEDANHTGLVTAFNDRYVWTIEGNTNSTGSREGDGVYVKQHERRSSRILGYGYPEYPEGIVTADPDPKWKRKGSTPPAPKPEPKPEPITRGPEVDLAIIALGRAKAKPGSKRDKALAQALAAALAVPPIKD